MIAKLKFLWWWYITIEQYPYHPNKYRRYSKLAEKHNRDIIAHELRDGKPILTFTTSELKIAGF